MDHASDQTQPKDLGLDYRTALHGVQSAIAHRMSLDPKFKLTDPKHLRVGVDSGFVSIAAISQILVDKGICTLEEFAEYQRLWANNELWMHEEWARNHYGHDKVKFR
jgi:hypothetical protein